MVITHRDVGRLIILSGKTRHGKNRINEHGERWKIREISTFLGRPAVHVESKDETFVIRTRDAAKTKEWTTKMLCTDSPSLLVVIRPPNSFTDFVKDM